VVNNFTVFEWKSLSWSVIPCLLWNAKLLELERLLILPDVFLNIGVFWDMTPCRFVFRRKCFGVSLCLHLLGHIEKSRLIYRYQQLEAALSLDYAENWEAANLSETSTNIHVVVSKDAVFFIRAITKARKVPRPVYHFVKQTFFFFVEGLLFPRPKPTTTPFLLPWQVPSMPISRLSAMQCWQASHLFWSE
jgi:hypothetical protein